MRPVVSSSVGVAALALLLVTGVAVPVAAATGGSTPADDSTEPGADGDGVLDPDLVPDDDSDDNETTNATDDGDDAVGSVTNGTDTVENGTTETTDSMTEVTNETTDAVESGTDTVENGTNETTDAVENATDDTADTATDTTNNTTDAVENATDDTTNATNGTTDAAGNVTGAIGDATEKTVDDATNGTVEAVEGTTDAVADTGDAVENVTDATAEAVENTTEAVDEVTDEVGDATGDSFPETDGIVEATADGTVETAANDADGNEPDAATATPTAEDPAQADTGTTATAADATGNQSDGESAGVAGSDGDSGGPGSGDGSGDADGGEGSGGSGSIPLSGAAVGALAVTVLGGAAVEGTLRSGELLAAGGGQFRTGVTASARTAASGLRSWTRGVRDRLWRLAVLFRYSRYDDSDPLEHDGRRAVYEVVEDAPGTYLSAVDERTDGSLSTVRHHLRILEEEDLLTERKVRGKRRYFPATEGEDPALVAALDDPATAAILEALAEVGPAPGGELASTLDRDPSTVSHHLSRLEDEGLVDRERDGRAVVNELSGAARRAMASPPEADAAGAPAVADD